MHRHAVLLSTKNRFLTSTTDGCSCEQWEAIAHQGYQAVAAKIANSTFVRSTCAIDEQASVSSTVTTTNTTTARLVIRMELVADSLQAADRGAHLLSTAISSGAFNIVLQKHHVYLFLPIKYGNATCIEGVSCQSPMPPIDAPAIKRPAPWWAQRKQPAPVQRPPPNFQL